VRYYNIQNLAHLDAEN